MNPLVIFTFQLWRNLLDKCVHSSVVGLHPNNIVLVFRNFMLVLSIRCAGNNCWTLQTCSHGWLLRMGGARERLLKNGKCTRMREIASTSLKTEWGRNPQTPWQNVSPPLSKCYWRPCVGYIWLLDKICYSIPDQFLLAEKVLSFSGLGKGWIDVYIWLFHNLVFEKENCIVFLRA